jgi:hypothetical protein
MTSLIGTRLFIHFTGVEMAQVLPINHGEPPSQEPGFYTLLGEVSGEYAGGIQFRLEKIFGRHDEEMQGDLSQRPEYLLPWGFIRRALVAKNKESAPPSREFGFREQR